MLPLHLPGLPNVVAFDQRRYHYGCRLRASVCTRSIRQRRRLTGIPWTTPSVRNHESTQLSNVMFVQHRASTEQAQRKLSHQSPYEFSVLRRLLTAFQSNRSATSLAWYNTVPLNAPVLGENGQGIKPDGLVFSQWGSSTQAPR